MPESPLTILLRAATRPVPSATPAPVPSAMLAPAPFAVAASQPQRNAAVGEIGTYEFVPGKPVPAHRHLNRDGSLGGWVADTATVESNVIVGQDALVYGHAFVGGNARLSGRARVYGFARVGGYARIQNHARVFGDARISNNANVLADSKVFGDAIVTDATIVRGVSKVFQKAKLYDQSVADGSVKLCGNVVVGGRHYFMDSKTYSSGCYGFELENYDLIQYADIDLRTLAAEMARWDGGRRGESSNDYFDYLNREIEVSHSAINLNQWPEPLRTKIRSVLFARRRALYSNRLCSYNIESVANRMYEIEGVGTVDRYVDLLREEAEIHGILKLERYPSSLQNRINNVVNHEIELQKYQWLTDRSQSQTQQQNPLPTE